VYGVAGWVDFDRSLPRERAAILAMTATMIQRGPDAEGVWLAEHFALGHHGLAVTDLVGGAQPMTADQDGGAQWLSHIAVRSTTTGEH
jgi:asparagine synthase (glutamine-hydrolysing)